jgi:phage terminase large subunit
MKGEFKWPPDYNALNEWRQSQVIRMTQNPTLAWGAFEYYRNHPDEFISYWVNTYDPRNAGQPGKLVAPPLVLWPRQVDLVNFLHDCVRQERSGLIEKSRDMGATWVACAFSVWLWLFWDGASIGWGSRKEMLVDRFGDLDSIFEKMRMIIKGLPPHFLPKGFNWSQHSNYMRLYNPENGASITGEAGDNIGRGGRKLVYFKDESAHYEHPEAIEAALADNTRVQIDISSVNGIGNVFHRRREQGIEWAPGRTIPRGRTAVFVMDWRAHPEKTDDWYFDRRKKAEDEGLLHLFYQEVDRNYASSVEGVIIPPDWVNAAIDAHRKLGFEDDGGWMGALDVADGGGDLNAFAVRKGVILKHVESWGARDTTVTAQKAVALAAKHKPLKVMYDCIGVGAGVKGETNRLEREEPGRVDGITFVDWNAANSPINPDDHVIPGDKNSPTNKDFYANLKAQGWWELRRRFEKTYKAVVEGASAYIDDLISLDSRSIPPGVLAQLKKELSQPTVAYTGRSKLIVDKQPEGVRSPNLADAVMMVYHPVRKNTYDESLSWVA